VSEDFVLESEKQAMCRHLKKIAEELEAISGYLATLADCVVYIRDKEGKLVPHGFEIFKG